VARGFKDYGEYIWGLKASDGPGPASKKIGGKMIRFYDYMGRGIPMRRCPHIINGLRRAGFSGGWLFDDASTE